MRLPGASQTDGAMASVPIILVLGASAAGKTCLVRRLLKGDAVDSDTVSGIMDTAATVGVEYDPLTLGKGVSCALREVGSAMRGMWSSYYGAAKGIIYVSDAAAPWKDAECLADVRELLTEEKLADKPMLLIFNKWDDVSEDDRPQRVEEMEDVLRLMPKPARVTCLQQVSVKDSISMDTIRRWITDLLR